MSDTDLARQVARLSAIEDIKQLKARYCAFCDQQYDPDGLAGHAHATAERLDADVVDRARLPGPAERLTHPGGSEFVGGVRDERVLRLRHRCGH